LPSDPRLRRAWIAVAVTFSAIALVALARVVLGPADAIDWVVLVLVIAAAIATGMAALAIADLDARRRSEASSRARLLSGLSRSISVDAIVDAIADGLGDATDADHVVVVRRRRDAPILEARLVTSTPGVSESITALPLSDLEDGGSPGAITDRLAARVREVYGLPNVIAAPLTGPGGVRGAIVLSRRRAEAWPEGTGEVLADAASEASAALERADSHRAAEAQATTDALTGLPNRRYFDEYVGLMASRRRSGDAVGVLMVDIDKFKALNDTHGHATGDLVLREVASAIVRAVRDDDVPARFGGEEFVVLLRNPDPGIALEVGERIRSAVGDLDMRRLGVRKVSVSVGVAVASEAEESIDDLVATADRALYRAKRAGRDRVVAA
jgi:diguanylate cyclase (GGDEF)-like protein